MAGDEANLGVKVIDKIDHISNILWCSWFAGLIVSSPATPTNETDGGESGYIGQKILTFAKSDCPTNKQIVQ